MAHRLGPRAENDDGQNSGDGDVKANGRVVANPLDDVATLKRVSFVMKNGRLSLNNTH